jgi:hypothetical protein
MCCSSFVLVRVMEKHLEKSPFSGIIIGLLYRIILDRDRGSYVVYRGSPTTTAPTDGGSYFPAASVRLPVPECLPVRRGPDLERKQIRT